ncbi:ATP-dependent Clp protease proteolytic subunit 3, chloroplastic-like [Chenopodium quinoa]|uniref:ATP-dependent Clp protease proteolytic subunit 3, chloroplastic-like n=1 Tax=Chenopodium quinoa TaxID=63459 RepID=UPI000B794892|nr:ATP-dependent Clp protease proteolytic subunit 3, chloroplastic-like [Chenopodium quinoa]
MELSSLTFTTPSSSTRPLTFFNHGFKQFKPSTFSGIKSFNQTRNRLIQANSLKGSIERNTLSSNWDVSAALAPRLPRFEQLDITNMLLRQRIIFLGSQIDDTTADFLISQLLLLDAEDPKKDIRLFINSPGGSVTAGMGIYDAMKQCKADVSTICMGLAASMGAFLLASGSKGKRFCMPNSKVMIHQPLGTAGGKATDMSIRIREMAYHKVKLNKILSRITGKSEEQIEKDTDRDNFLNPWEAKEYGLVDDVIDDGKPGLVAPIGDTSPPPKTKVWDQWKIEGSRKARKNLPSELKLIRNGYAGSQSDEDKGIQQDKDTPTSV